MSSLDCKVKKRVVILGGGVAGLSAATNLLKQGQGNFDVTLLEADDRIGGRVQTLKFGNYFIENGAQWVHGEENNSVYLKAKPLGLVDTSEDLLKFNADSIFVTQQGVKLSDESHKKCCNYLDKLHEGPNNYNSKPEESVGDWAERIFWEGNDKDPLHNDVKVTYGFLDWCHRFQNSIDGSDNWFQPSCKGQQEYWNCVGNPVIAWKPPFCYASFLNLLLHDKPTAYPELTLEIPDWIHLNKEVVNINYQSEKDIIVQCKDGSIYNCDHVICTVSLGVLKDQANSLFTPAIPEDKLKAIKYLGISCVNKIHFEFPNKWWPDKLIGFNLVWNDCDIIKDNWKTDVDEETLKRDYDGFPIWCRSILGFYVVVSHPTTLNSWINGPAAKFIEKLSDEEVQSIFMKVLKKFIGSLYDIPEPLNFVRSKWFSNPYTKGSYSFRSVESEMQNVWSYQLASPIFKNNKPVICFAGEATHAHFYSTVHGAHDSGLREATRLTNFYKNITDELSPMYPYDLEIFDDN